MPQFNFWNSLSTAVLTLALLAPLIYGNSTRAADSFSGRIVLNLDKALQQKYKKGDRPDGRPLNIYLTAEDGRWTDAWGENQNFNRAIHECEVEYYLDWILYKCLHRQHRVGTVNWQPGSNYTAVIDAGNGTAALALCGEKGPAPVEPLPPRESASHIAPPADFVPARGVPVVKFDVGP